MFFFHTFSANHLAVLSPSGILPFQLVRIRQFNGGFQVLYYCLPDSLLEFPVYPVFRIRRFSQPLADTEMELSVGNQVMQGTIQDLYVYRMIGSAGTHADEGRIGRSLISELGSKYFRHGGCFCKRKITSGGQFSPIILLRYSANLILWKLNYDLWKSSF